ncbi:phenylalanine--tRNA ligase subunit beta [Parasphingopyxis algicola]|uniref:phenylalanine--tRNA ligase subunit beta n=1 Tax=Parasphingopyxis algicola TaxID=2026624 RepID=UPI0015A2C535|nr:phenylalanine--tRNA ligase subunit beta [Parasphingopyxis algicola]QLC25608.1 phenylalanine--tRNA ligase subunit beta [Parasphingopyxis algicola]
MKFTLGWLKQHLETEADLDTVLDTLTAIGLEVEGVENPGETLADFRIARVVSADRHPNADKLQLLQVDTGDGIPVQVVCGAPNARAGLVGVFAAPGTYVPGIDTTLKPAKIRDIESFGMMCSERELEMSDEHQGIIDLDESAAAEVGESYAHWAGLDDPVIDLKITPNRQDCMGVRGIARDLAVAGLGTLKPLQVREIKGQNEPSIEIRTDDPEGCPAFFGRTVAGVSNGASPDWMQKRLRAIGQKPISALVDITNYIMIDHGRPLHVYDRAKLGEAIFARRAENGERVVALNGKDYVLDDSMTVIADENGVHDIGGIMGGEDSGVQPETADIVIECAYFDPPRIARTGQKLGLMSDARARFERGVDPAFLDDGLAIATQLILDICGGEPSETVEAGAPPLDTKTIRYDPHLCATLGGVSVPIDTQRATLEALGFTVGGDGPFEVTVPTWRRDVDGAPDLVEEVLRIERYDAIPSTPLPRAEGVATPTASPEQKRERTVRRAAAARGLNEAVTWSFIPQAEAALSNDSDSGAPWILANPISEDMKVMRTAMIPGLAAAAKRNADRGAASIRLFEIGRRYLEQEERPTLGLILAGARDARHWQGGGDPFDAYDAKAEIVALLEAAGAPAANLQLFGDASGHYHPGRSGRLCLGPKNMLAEFGELHPNTLKALDLDGPVMAGEIYLDAIPMPKAKGSGAGKAGGGHMRKPFTPPALQSVTRDFAFLLDTDTPAGDLLRAVRNADKQALVDARIFDVFTGEGVPEGKKSVAIEVTLQPGDKSFTEEDLKAISDKVVKAAGKVGGELRG